MKSAIIANGCIRDYGYIKNIIESNHYDYIVCADGGAVHAYNMNILPNLLVGDYDSIDKDIFNYLKDENIKIVSFPVQKDKTDTHIAIDYALKKKSNKIDLYGVTGTRLDHTLSNINHLIYIKQNGSFGRIIDEHNEIIYTDIDIKVEGCVGDTISILSIAQKSTGVKLNGLEYNLDTGVLLRGDSIGISNVFAEPIANIAVKNGQLIIIKSID